MDPLLTREEFPIKRRSLHQPSSLLMDEWNPLSRQESLCTEDDASLFACPPDDYLRLNRERFLNVAVEESPSTHNNNKNDRYLSTGTTIVGLVWPPDTCILAADTRATAGSLVADQRADKLHPLSDNYAAAAGAGTSADLDHLTRECFYTQRLRSRLQAVGNNPESEDTTSGGVLEVVHFLKSRLYEQGGACQANLIVGGVDPTTGQPHLRAVHPHGSVDVLSFTALGSGGLAAMAVLERQYQNLRDKNATRDDAIRLAVEAVHAGIVNDLGSGSQVDLVVITRKEGCQYTRSILPEEALPVHEGNVTETESLGGGGVNGFGNLPFSIRSERVVRVSADEERRKEQENWKDILST